MHIAYTGLFQSIDKLVYMKMRVEKKIINKKNAIRTNAACITYGLYRISRRSGIIIVISFVFILCRDYNLFCTLSVYGIVLYKLQ